jgi:hypothetical protein
MVEMRSTLSLRAAKPKETEMNARDAFDLEFLGRTTVQDGRDVVVYSDGRHRHAVLAGHWDDCGFGATEDGEERADNYAAWNRDSDQWVDDLTAIEAAHRLGVLHLHSASGCGLLEADSRGACQAIASAHRGSNYTSPAFIADADRVNWDGLWPLVDRNGELTGRVTEGDGCYNVGDAAMIEKNEARAGGWLVDADDAYATQPPAGK